MTPVFVQILKTIPPPPPLILRGRKLWKGMHFRFLSEHTYSLSICKKGIHLIPSSTTSNWNTMSRLTYSVCSTNDPSTVPFEIFYLLSNRHYYSGIKLGDSGSPVMNRFLYVPNRIQYFFNFVRNHI